MGLRDFAQSSAVAEQSASLASAYLRAQVERVRPQAEAYYDAILTADADEIGSAATGDQFFRPIVLGIGVTAAAGEERPLVVVDLYRLDTKLPEAEPVPIEQVEEIETGLADLLDGRDQLAGAVVIGVPEPEPHFRNGGGVKCLGRNGTLGALVTSRDGRDGILTAGHVAQQSAIAHDDSGNTGHVAFSINPASIAAAAVTADVAVIEPVRWDPPALTVGGTYKAVSRDQVTMVGNTTGAANADVHGYCTFFNWPGAAGAWADVYLTGAGISNPGDSGAPVFKDGTDLIVGHLVGGSGKVMSYVQDIDTQLAAAGATLR